MAPNDVFSHSTIAFVYYQQRDYDRARNHLVKVLMLDPKNASAHHLLGIVASQKGWSDPAEAAQKRAVELDPSYAAGPDETETGGSQPVGDFLTPLEQSRAGVPVEARK